MRLTKHIREDFALEDNAKRHGVRQSPAAFSFPAQGVDQLTSMFTSIVRRQVKSARGLAQSKTLRAFWNLFAFRFR